MSTVSTAKQRHRERKAASAISPEALREVLLRQAAEDGRTLGSKELEGILVNFGLAHCAIRKQTAAKPRQKMVQPPRTRGEKTEAQRAKSRREHAKWRARHRPPISAVIALMTELEQRYPAVFGQECRPFAAGIHRSIAAEMECDKRVLRSALNYWVSQAAYIAAMSRATHRYALDGSPAAAITDAERAAASERLGPALQRLRARHARTAPCQQDISIAQTRHLVRTDRKRALEVVHG